MKLIKKLLILQALIFSIVLISSCKTKEAVAQQAEYDQKLADRNQDQSDALGISGLEADAADALLEKMKKMDEELMNFLATDPSQDARSEFLAAMMRDKESTIRGSMTPEQYEAYRKALLAKTREKAMENGTPTIKPGG